MPTIHVNLKGDGAWPELARSDVDILPGPDTWHIAALEGGMHSGAPALALRLDVQLDNDDDGIGRVVVIAHTSLAAWIAATCALRAAFPEAFAGTPLEAP